MRVFRDDKGRDWTLNLTIDAVKRIKALTGFDLMRLDSVDENGIPLVQKLAIDVCCIADVSFALVKPDADRLNVSDADFAASLGGDAMRLLMDAMTGEIRDFFQKLGRTELVRMIDQARAFVAKMISLTEDRVEAIKLDSILGESSTNSPELREFRPAV